MDSPQLIALDDIVLRDDLDPRLGERDDDLIAQYADIFDALPPIEINQHNEVIDGWHRVRAAERAKRTEIAYVVVETEDDDDLGDRMWESNLKHGVQYTRLQRKTQGIKLHERGMPPKDIGKAVGASLRSVYIWTKEYRASKKQERQDEMNRLHEQGLTKKQIADQLGIDATTVGRNLQNRKSAKVQDEPEREAEPTIEDDEEQTGQEPNERPVEEQEAQPELESESPSAEPEMNETLADEEPATPDIELESPPTPEPIPDDILNTARAVMGDFTETRPDDFVARLEASPSEWMTITDDSLSNELERELLTSAAAMCLWQELMIWYQGENASTFTDAFGKIGAVFVRGQSGQWSIVSKLRSILRRLRA